MRPTVILVAAVYVMCTIPLAAQPFAMLRGTVVGVDGKPLPQANIQLQKHGFTITDTALGADGTFEIPLSETGGYRLMVSGVNHTTTQFPVCVWRAGQVNVAVRLKTYERIDSLDELFLIGNFNAFDFTSKRIPMKKGKDGTWSAVVNSDSAVVRYQLLGLVEGRSVNGTMAERFEYDGQGDFICVVTPKKREARIVFDPALLPTSGGDEVVQFDDAVNNALRDYDHLRSVFQNAANERRPARGSTGAKKTNDSLAAEIDRVYTDYLARAEREADPAMQECLRMKALAWRLTYGQPDTSFLHVAWKIPAASPLWSVDIWAYAQLCAEECKTAGSTSLTEGFLASTQPSSDKEELFTSLLANYKEAGDSLHVREYYHRFLREYPESRSGAYVKMVYNLDSKVAVGKRCPAFSFRNLDDTTKFITDTSLLGKVVLLHFYSNDYSFYFTELDGLNEQYHKDGLEIVSFGFWSTPEQTAQFRKGQFHMKWKHARTKTDAHESAMDIFDVASTPYTVLIDRDGTILQSGFTFYLQEMLALELRAAVLKGR